MRIAIDYTPAVCQRGGIGRYTRELVRALAEQAPHHEYVLLVAGCPASPLGTQALRAVARLRHFHVRRIPLPARWLTILWQRLRLPIPAETFTGPIDIFHAPDYVLPPLRRARGVVTIHDLSFLILPEVAEPKLQRYLSQAVPRAVARAQRVLADSRCTRDDLIAHLNVAPERITVVYPGVDPRFRPLEEETVEAFRERHALPARFILGLGTLEPRKNFPTLIEAYARLPEWGIPHHEVALVIAGGKGWLYEGIFETVERLALQKHVRFLGFVPDEELPALYNAASVLAFPSLYEGFGLPPLEAMACGTPVVASNVSSLPEVLDDAAPLVSPTDVEKLAAVLAQVLTDPDRRAALRARGLRQAARFTWEAAARALLRAYQEL